MIILVRHGRTTANAQGLLLGRNDPPLDDEGRRQAGLVGRSLGSLDIARVITSPLGRCRQTAEAITGALGPLSGAPPPIEVDERWIELDYGALEGVPVGEVPTETWAAWQSDVGWTPDGGESIAALGARVRDACDAVAAESVERDVVVVTHVSPIKAAVAWSLGVSDDIAWRMWVAPASLSRVGWNRHVPSLRSFNELAHLT